MQRLITTTDTTTTGINKFNTTVTDTTDSNKKDFNYHDNDVLFEELSDLVNSQYRAWYCKRFYELGRLQVTKMASIARADGKNPKRYFSKMLKEGEIR